MSRQHLDDSGGEGQANEHRFGDGQDADGQTADSRERLVDEGGESPAANEFQSDEFPTVGGEDDPFTYDPATVMDDAEAALGAPGANDGRPYYEYDDDTGITSFVHDVEKKDKIEHVVSPVFRFKLTVRAIFKSATRSDRDAPWILYLQVRGGQPQEYSMPPEARDSKFKAAAWLASNAPYCVIELEQEKHFLQALKESASEAQIRLLPERMGWFEDPSLGWVHLASGRDYAIGANGIERSIFLDKRLIGKSGKDLFHDTQLHFGALVKPCETDEERIEAEAALRDLILVAPHAVSMPWLVANFLAPLRTVVLQTDVPTVMLTSQTGSRKTSYSNAVASMFGTFSSSANKRGVSVAQWSTRTSTASMTRLLHVCGDHPLVVQDFKKKTANKDTVALIQSVTDNSTQQRAERTGALREGQGVNVMVLATGEQSFAEEASVASRVFEIPMTTSDIDNDILTRIQRAARDGVLQRVGGDYLQWVAACGILTDSTLEHDKDVVQAWLLPKLSGLRIHDGVIQTGVVMLAGLRILRRFIHATYSPAFAQEMDAHMREGQRAILARTIARGHAAAETSEVHVFLEAFMSGLYERNDAYYSLAYDPHRWPGGRYVPGGANGPGPRAESIARHRFDSKVDFTDPIFLITDAHTFAWFAKTHRDTTLTWPSLKAELTDPEVGGRYVPSAKLTPVDDPNVHATARGVELRKSQIEKLLAGPAAP